MLLENKKSLSSKLNTLDILQYVIYGSLILYVGRDVFVPLSFALLISFVLYPVCIWLEKRGIGRMTAILLCIGMLLLVVIAIVGLLAKQFFDFLQEWPNLETKLNFAVQQLSQWLIDSYEISPEQQAHWIAQATDQTFSNAFTFLKQTISFSAFSFVMLILIPVYVVLILFYRNLWVSVLFRIFPRQENIKELLFLTIQAYYNFIKGMGLVYLAVGVLNSVGLLALGVPHAILFGCIASVLTFIPYIGIMVGSLLPIAMAWITYDSIWYPIGIIMIFTFVQYLEANLIFPLAVSNRLKVNTMVVLLAIFIGGIVWGVAGMILFVPFVGIVKLIADTDPKLETLSIALGTVSEKK